MRIPRQNFRASAFRWSVRSLLACVLACATALGWLRWQIDSYQKDWEVEQRALREMRAAGVSVTASSRPIGPAWLRSLAGAGGAKYFDRVDMLYFVATLPDERHLKPFTRLRGYMVD
jgi:hypothetical protein